MAIPSVSCWFVVLFQCFSKVGSFSRREFLASLSPHIHSSDHSQILPRTALDASAQSSKYSKTGLGFKPYFYVHISYEDERGGVDVPVFEGETILSALETAYASGRINGDGIIAPPSDCRRGNCLTCSARHKAGSKVSNLQSTEEGNGLSPHIERTLEQNGYVLTCSSVVTGEGVSLTLGENNQLWDYVYRKRLETESAESVAHAAMAKAIRRSAERNVAEWTEQTENIYQKSSSESEENVFLNEGVVKRESGSEGGFSKL